jgi:hypothetical protein
MSDELMPYPSKDASPVKLPADMQLLADRLATLVKPVVIRPALRAKALGYGRAMVAAINARRIG